MFTRRIKIVSFLWLLLLPFCGYSQKVGKYATQNFPPKVYRSATQIWGITQDKRGFIYFGTEDGVVEYDGTDWSTIRLSNKSTARSIDITDEGRVFVGGVGDVGYLAPDSVGQLAYVSLMDSIPEEYREFSDVWGTHTINNEAYFHTRKAIIKWKEGKVTLLKPTEEKGNFYRIHKTNNKLYAHETAGIGFLELNDDGEFELLKGGDFFARIDVVALLPYSDSEILFCTNSKGFYIYDMLSGESEPFATEADAFVIKNGARAGLITKNTKDGRNNFIISTLYGGVVILDKEGKIVHEINEKTGLADNQILSIFLDKDKALWTGMGNGLSRVDISSPITLWDKSIGLEGKSLTSVFDYKGIIYITNDFAINYFDKEANKFKLVEGLDKSLGWKLFKFTFPTGEEKLFAALSQGLFEIDYNKATLISGGGNTQTIYVSEVYPNRIFIGGGDGVRTIKYNPEENRWINEGKIPGFRQELALSIVEKNGTFWIGTDHQGILKFTFENISVHDRLITKTNIIYSFSKGLPSISKNKVFKLKKNTFLQDELVFTTEKGAYTYSEEEDKIVPSNIFGGRYNFNKLAISNLHEAENGDIWLNLRDSVTNLDKIERAILQTDGTYLIDSLSYRELGGKIAESVYVKDSILWVPTGDGAYRYDMNIAKTKKESSFSTLIREVLLLRTHEDIFYGTYYDELYPELVSMEQPTNLKPILKYIDNSISFFYSAPTFDETNQTVYSYFLEGHDTDWSPWKRSTKKEYTNLSESAEYVFKVKARNIHGQISKEANFAFEVLAPWYRTLWAYIAYTILGLLLIVGIVKVNSSRYKGENLRLEAVITDRTQEVVKQNNQIEAKNAYLKEQKREIAKQKDKIEESYQNVKLLSSLGQDIVATRSVEALTKKVYQDINALMDASGFGIGVYNLKNNTIDFRGFIEKGETLEPHEESINDKSLLSVWCLKHARKIVINDLKNEIYRYIEDYQGTLHGEIPASLIYLPLIANDNVIGVITVQSFEKQAFNYYHVDIMENLATYVAISMDNTLLYENLEEKVEQRTAEIERKTEVIEKKNALIEKKNSDITASINYAKRIQTAFLPKVSEVQAVLPDSFIIFKPRDIISGDFYWFAKKGDKVIIAAVDCTGHGVPGAFMSMIGNDLLNEAVNLLNIINPEEILRHMHVGVRQTLRQIETGNQDGMDMSICVINQKEKVMTFAGAKNPLVYMQDGQMYLIKGDRGAVGGRQREVKRMFTRHTIPIVKSTTCYLFTDGFQDQTGGPEGRKFMTKKFRELLHEIHFYSMEEQCENMEQKLDQWMGDRKQVDDILLIGFSTT